ncbi:hypothetical protein J6590_104110, partial [Homalodisca vitripennis]
MTIYHTIAVLSSLVRKSAAAAQRDVQHIQSRPRRAAAAETLSFPPAALLLSYARISAASYPPLIDTGATRIDSTILEDAVNIVYYFNSGYDSTPAVMFVCRDPKMTTKKLKTNSPHRFDIKHAQITKKSATKNKEAQNEPLASFRHQRHQDYKKVVHSKCTIERTTMLADATPKRDGATESPADESPKPDGATESPADAIPKPDGATESPAGATPKPDGATESPADAIPKPDGATESPAGATAKPDGATESPADATLKPDGATESPAGATAKPDG